MAWAVFNRVGGDNISTFVKTEVGMWEREYVRACPIPESLGGQCGWNTTGKR